jgi:hypothetical protein
MDKHETYLTMRLKIDEVFEHYAAQSEYYKRANIAQRFEMEDAFYRRWNCWGRLLDRLRREQDFRRALLSTRFLFTLGEGREEISFASRNTAGNSPA